MKTVPARAKRLKASATSSRGSVVSRKRQGKSLTPIVPVISLSAEEGEQGPFPLQQLRRIARQSGIAEPLACASSLTLLKTSRVVNHCLYRILKPLGLSEGRFAALVTLYALDPMPASSADLAYHTEMTRPAMTGLLDTMQERGWISRDHRIKGDRRLSCVSLTDAGRDLTTTAIDRFLKSAADISGDLRPTQHRLLDTLCARLLRRSMMLEA